MPDTNDVGARIAQIRESRGLTTDQLAERSQLSAELIREIENGALIPSLAPLIKIARVLGVRLGTFMDAEEVQDFCRGQIARYKIPKYVFFVREYPITGNGKVQKYKLREMSLEMIGKHLNGRTWRALHTVPVEPPGAALETVTDTPIDPRCRPGRRKR